jgi:hypothetical protein
LPTSFPVFSVVCLTASRVDKYSFSAVHPNDAHAQVLTSILLYLDRILLLHFLLRVVLQVFQEQFLLAIGIFEA